MKNNLAVWLAVILIVLVFGVIGYSLYKGAKNNMNNMNNNNTGTTNTQTTTTPGTVIIQNFAFSPHALTVKAGDTVTWKNNDSYTHHIVADDGSFDLGDVAPGGTSTHTFTTAGNIAYHCAIHTYMTGTVVVQ